MPPYPSRLSLCSLKRRIGNLRRWAGAISLGRLLGDVTVEKMLDDIFVPRNEILKGVMFGNKHMGSIGLGVNKIHCLVKEHNGTIPELTAEDGQFTIRLFAKR